MQITMMIILIAQIMVMITTMIMVEYFLTSQQFDQTVPTCNVNGQFKKKKKWQLFLHYCWGVPEQILFKNYFQNVHLHYMCF